MDERTPAEQQLTAHHDAGLLDDDDYLDRMARARLATSRAELDELFADLPGGYDDTPDDYRWPVLGGQPTPPPTWTNPPTSPYTGDRDPDGTVASQTSPYGYPSSQPSPYADPAQPHPYRYPTSQTSPYAQPSSGSATSYADAFPYADPAAGDPYAVPSQGWRQPPPVASPEVPVVVPPAPRTVRRDNQRTASLISGLAWPVCIFMLVATGSWWWILIPIFVTPLIVNALRGNKN